MPTYNYFVGSITNNSYTNSTFLNTHWTANVYEFSVDNSRDINLNLHNISEGDDADLSLYSDSDNNSLFDPSIDTYLIGSSNGGNSDDTINDYSVEAGTYFAQVESYDLGVDNFLTYTLDLTQNEETPLPTYNYYVGSITNNSYTNSTFLNTHWTANVYEFSVDNPRRINLNLHNISEGDDADLSLYSDRDNNGLFDPSIDIYLIGSSNGGNSDDTINDYSVEAGTYFAQVESYDLGVDNFLTYTLDITENIVVDNFVDENDGNLSPGDVSLREAIAFSSNGGTIDFDSSLAGGTISLGLGELVIDKDLTINGLGADQLTISGNNASRVFLIDDRDENNLINVEIEGLTIADGSASEQLFPGIPVEFPAPGGGILNREDLTVTNSTIRNNGASAGSGIDNSGNLTVTNSTIDNNVANFSAGGIINSGSLTVTNSTIDNNVANFGAGIANSGSLTVTSSTISGNSANGAAGEGGGINTYNSNVVTIKNTIIAGNSSSLSDQPDVSGNFTTTSYNLIGDGTGSTGFTNGVDGNQVGTSDHPIDPLLGSLQNNGGSTETHALLDNSPAIDAGDPNFTSPPDFDQRGEGFLRVFDGNEDGIATVDIGAVELIHEDNYEPNNTLETAYDITGLEQTQLNNIDLGVANNEDWYKIETVFGFENLMINLQFTHAEGDIDLILHDSNGDEIARSASATDNELINVPAPAGIYYLEVYPYQSSDVGNTYDLWWDDVATL